MLHLRSLFYFVATMNISVLAIPAKHSFPLAAREHQDSTETRSLAGRTLTNLFLPDIKNLTIPTVSFPELNNSSNAAPPLICHANRGFPVAPAYFPINVYECALIVLNMLALDSPDLASYQWSPIYPIQLPWVQGTTTSCQIQLSATNPRAVDIFPIAMIAQRAALIVHRCVGELGGYISVGPKQEFRVDVYALPPGVTA